MLALHQVNAYGLSEGGTFSGDTCNLLCALLVALGGDWQSFREASLCFEERNRDPCSILLSTCQVACQGGRQVLEALKDVV